MQINQIPNSPLSNHTELLSNRKVLNPKLTEIKEQEEENEL